MIERRSAVHTLLTQEAKKYTVAEPAVLLTERHPLAILQVSAFNQTHQETEALLSSTLNIALPLPNHLTSNQILSVRNTAPGVWQIVGDAYELISAQALRTALESTATVVDLSHARSVFLVSGSAATKTIAKFCGLDLEANQFPTGSATNTRFEHISMTLARTDDAPTFELMVFRGYAQHVGESLIEGAAEFGLKILAIDQPEHH